jgi:chemotaxis protein methyltransferase CheR
MGALPLQPQVFAILRALIEDRAGLAYDLADLDLLAGKLSPRALELGFDSLLDYYYFLRYDIRGAEELDVLVETLLVNETYFFREPDQLSVLIDVLLAPLLKAGVRPRVWCAASSTGEEPYTLAMLLAERELLGRVEIVATDLSRRVLAQAQKAEYGGRSLRAVKGTPAERWLERRGDRRVVPLELRRAVSSWQRVNLLVAEEVSRLGQFDAIVCRNVLIYFSDDTARKVVQHLRAALSPGGHLLVGASESLMRFGTSLVCEERAGSFFYRSAA